MSIQLRSLEKRTYRAATYQDWKDAALEHDELSGKDRWRQSDRTNLYDYAQIRDRLDHLRKLRASHDHMGLLYALNEGIHGNMGGMGRAETGSSAGTWPQSGGAGAVGESTGCLFPFIR